jgi:predicted HicB family RNase H-like nuclease
MNQMAYRGYTAHIQYSDEDDCFIGEIIGIHDIVSFHGETVTELHEAFEEAVDDYLDTCAKIGRAPNKPYSGQFRLRIPADLHAQAAIAAKTRGKSLNTWVTEVIATDLSRQEKRRHA